MDSEEDAALPPFDLGRLRTAPLTERRHLVDTTAFGGLADPDGSVTAFLDSLPDVLAARALRELAGHVARAHRGGHHVAVAMGGHVVKTGNGPVLIDLLRRGVVTSLHMAGSAAIHDWEIARAGRTSEDVGAGLLAGEYGTSDETGRAFAEAAARGAADGTGLGRALGASIEGDDFSHRDASLLAEAARLGIPCTVHVAIGTDTVHIHPAVDGATLGEASLLDFRIACSVVERLNHGVWMNLGSAVVMPEVLLKCVTVAANTGAAVDDLTTANFDMLRHYRPRTNVVQRPAARGYDVAGHHEIMIPLLRVAILKELGS